MDQKTKILCVDDEFFNLQLFRINLRKKYDVLMAENGFEALKILENHPEIKVVFSDIKMPLMDGMEFMELANERYKDKMFFVITGFEKTDEILAAINNGLVVRYFSKPYSFTEIDDAIVAALNSSGTLS